jgi:hypothetical protein
MEEENNVHLGYISWGVSEVLKIQYCLENKRENENAFLFCVGIKLMKNRVCFQLAP